jgi:hypothetical protein
MEAQFGYSELLEGMPVAVATASSFFRPTLEILVTLPSGGVASLAASAACPLLI